MKPYLPMRFFAPVIILLCFSISLYAQRTTRGVVLDQDQEPVANVKIEEVSTGNVVFSNDDGVFLLSYFASDSRILFTKDGYDSLVRPLNNEDKVFIFLTAKKSTNTYHLGYHVGYLDFKHKNKNKNLESMPYFLGEADINRQLQMLPGIEQGSEGYSNLFVRGGDVDQNLLLYNGTPIYNQNHIFGISSVFHNRSIHNTSVYRGIAPSQYGGRGSSVISLESKKQDKFRDGKMKGELEITPINIGIYLENFDPGKTKKYYTIAARRSWLDLFLPQEVKQNSLNANIYDLQVNFGWELKNKDKLDFSLMNTRDLYFIGFTSTDTASSVQSFFGLEQRWSNLLGSAKYTQYFGERITAEHSLHYSGYQSNFGIRQVRQDTVLAIQNPPTTELNQSSSIRDIGAHSNWKFQVNNKHLVSFGLQTNTRLFRPRKYVYTTTNFTGLADVEELEGEQNFTPSFEIAFYGEDKLRLNENTIIDFGLRNVLYSYEDYTQFAVEPRLHFTSYLKNNDVIKAAYNRHNQFVGLLNIGTAGSPDNIWVPATEGALPQAINMLEAGYEKRLGSEYSVSVNAYLRTMNNLIRVSDLGDALDASIDWRRAVVQGSGNSSGVEVMFQKSAGDFTGWLSYAYSRSTRLFEDLSEEEFDFTFNRPHMFKVYANYSPPYADWNLGFNYLIGSGQLFTLPIGKYRDIDGNTILEYDALNNYRSPMYQRFDISIIRKRSRMGIPQEWRFYVYNTFLNRNPLYVNPVFTDGSFTDLTIERNYLAFVPGVAFIMRFD